MNYIYIHVSFSRIALGSSDEQLRVGKCCEIGGLKEDCSIGGSMWRGSMWRRWRLKAVDSLGVQLQRADDVWSAEDG